MKKATLKDNSKDLAEAYVYPVQLTPAQRKQAALQLMEARKKSRSQMSDTDKLVANLLQLKFRLEDYMAAKEFNPEKTFGHFLKEYLSLVHKKRKEFAREINIHETLLSQLINDRREPGDNIIIRLELHSNNSIPAFYWHRIVEKKKEYYLHHNKQLRKEESRFVKSRLAVSV